MQDDSELETFRPKEDFDGGCDVPRLRTRDISIVALFWVIRIMTLNN